MLVNVDKIHILELFRGEIGSSMTLLRLGARVRAPLVLKWTPVLGLLGTKEANLLSFVNQFRDRITYAVSYGGMSMRDIKPGTRQNPVQTCLQCQCPGTVSEY